MDEIIIYEVVKKLIGNINPVGETNEDGRRYDNLKMMIHVVENLITDLDDLEYNHKDSHEYSVKRSADEAAKFFAQMKSNLE